MFRHEKSFIPTDSDLEARFGGGVRGGCHVEVREPLQVDGVVGLEFVDGLHGLSSDKSGDRSG